MDATDPWALHFACSHLSASSSIATSQNPCKVAGSWCAVCVLSCPSSHHGIRQLRQVLIQCATCKLKGPPGCCAVSLVACQRSIDVARRLEAGRCCSTSYGCGSQGWVSPSDLKMERRCGAHLGCCLAARRRKSGPLWWHHESCIQILLHLSRTQAPQDSHAGITEMPTV